MQIPVSKRTALILFLALAYALGPFTVDPFTPAFPKIAATFSVSNALLQFSMTGVTLGMGLGQLFAGPFSDSIGRKRPMLVAIALYVLGAFASSLAPDIWWFIGSRTLMAVGSSGAAVLAAAIVRDAAAGDAMLKLLSRIFWIQGFAPVLAPIIGSQVIQVADWRLLFQIFGVVAAVGMVWGVFGLTETLATERRRGSVFTGMGARFIHVLRDRSYRGLVLISLMTTVQLYAYLNVFPFLFLDLLKVDQNLYGVLAASVSLTWLLAFQLSASIAPRWGYLKTLVASMALGVLAGIGGLTIGVSVIAVPVHMALIYLAVVAFGASTGPLQTLSLAPHGEEAGTAAALMGTINFLVTALLSPIFTVLPTNSFAGLGGVYLVCFAIGLGSALLVVKPALTGSTLR